MDKTKKEFENECEGLGLYNWERERLWSWIEKKLHQTRIKDREEVIKEFRRIVDPWDYEWDKGKEIWEDHLKSITQEE